jgi:hypothetical protein
MPDPEDDWAKLAQTAEADERARLGRQQGVDSTRAIAMVNLRDLARKAEEAAVILEGAGYQTLPGELLKISGRLVEIREVLERLSGRST